MKKISKALALSLSAFLLFAGCNMDGDADYEGDGTEITDSSNSTTDGTVKTDDSEKKPSKPNSTTPEKTEITYSELPVVPVGNSMTRIDGAGIMINVDNSTLGISGVNAKDTTIEVKITDTDSNSEVSYQFAQWDDYKGSETVRLYIVLNEVHSNLKVEAKAKINGTWYAKTVDFVDSKYSFSFDVTGIRLTAGATEVKPGDSVDLSVIDTTYGLVQTVTFEVTPSTAGTVENGKFTAAADAEDGEVTIKAIYSEEVTDEITISINANALPTILSSSRIDGAGVQIFVSKNVISTVPSIEDVSITGDRTASGDFAGFAGTVTKIGNDVLEVNDQGEQFRIFFTKDNGFPNGATVTESFVITFGKVTINATFTGNTLVSSSISIEE